jgi:hypothetical protein
MRKTIKFLTALSAAFALVVLGITPASAEQVGKQNFSDPYDSNGLSDIIDVQVDSYEEEPTFMNVYLAFDAIVPVDLFTPDYFGVGLYHAVGLEIDVDGDDFSDYRVDSGFKSLSPGGETVTIWDVVDGDTGCEAVFFGFPEEEADYVGFAIDDGCLELPETFGLRAYVVRYADISDVLDMAPGNSNMDFYKVTNPTAHASLLTLTKTPVPTIKGTAGPGCILTASTGQWDPGVSFSFQWLKNGEEMLWPIGGDTYETTGADINARISVRVTGSKAGYIDATMTSAAVVIKLSKLSKTPTPTVTGTTKAGKSLSARAGTWDSGVKLSYQWLRNGVAIKGATKATYKLAAADKGKKISVKVTGTKPGYVTVVKTSATKTISK